MNTSGQLGGALSAGMFGYIVKWSGGYQVPVVVMAVLVAVLSAIPWLVVDASRVLVDDTPAAVEKSAA